jgi:hypothetical protein
MHANLRCVSMRIPLGVLRREKVVPALERFPQLKMWVPRNWLDRQERTGQLVDTHRVYRWLAAGGIGWSGEQLASLEGLIMRVARKHAGLDRKLGEFWNADDDRFDSLSTELLLADHLLSRGHLVDPEPEVGGRRPEYLVDKVLLIEAYTYCPRREDGPRGRLLFELTHRLDTGCLLEVDIQGDLTSNDVGPIVRQAAVLFTRDNCHAGKMRRVAHGGVELFIKVVDTDDELLEGSNVSSVPRTIPDEDLLRRTFLPWLEVQAKAADEQMGAYEGPKVAVIDISYCRVAADMLQLNASAVRRVLEDVQRMRPAIQVLIATRFWGQQFGPLCFIPCSPTERLSRSAA